MAAIVSKQHLDAILTFALNHYMLEHQVLGSMENFACFVGQIFWHQNYRAAYGKEESAPPYLFEFHDQEITPGEFVDRLRHLEKQLNYDGAYGREARKHITGFLIEATYFVPGGGSAINWKETEWKSRETLQVQKCLSYFEKLFHLATQFKGKGYKALARYLISNGIKTTSDGVPYDHEKLNIEYLDAWLRGLDEPSKKTVAKVRALGLPVYLEGD